eukprot:15332839-Ditylum_brightwellii.AAC.1
MEHHLWDIKCRANECVQAIMVKALLKLKIIYNNEPIKNMRQYRDYCKYFLVHALTADEAVLFYKRTHFAVTVAAFNFKYF